MSKPKVEKFIIDGVEITESNVVGIFRKFVGENQDWLSQSIYFKICKINEYLPPMGKDAQNFGTSYKPQTWNFHTVEKMKDVLKQMEAIIGVCCVPIDSILLKEFVHLIKGKEGEPLPKLERIVKKSFRFINANDHKDYFDCSALAESFESQEKGINKCETYALKNIYKQVYRVVARDDKDRDPDYENGAFDNDNYEKNNFWTPKYIMTSEKWFNEKELSELKSLLGKDNTTKKEIEDFVQKYKVNNKMKEEVNALIIAWQKPKPMPDVIQDEKTLPQAAEIIMPNFNQKSDFFPIWTEETSETFNGMVKEKAKLDDLCDFCNKFNISEEKYINKLTEFFKKRQNIS